jgi:DNA mismatch repair protein MutL
MIHILPPEIANRIAAGEVVERPASVVRELIDNAIDAEATRIDVAIEDGGFASITVTDNGCGMSPDDALLCVKRHATSKIQSAEDLERIVTKGFRGEALAAISAVSKFTLKTRRKDDEFGFATAVTGGVEEPAQEVGAAIGTTITIRDLFFNTPARKKFLKKPATEMGHVIATVTWNALAHERVHFTFAHNGRRSVDAPAVSSRIERIQQLFGKDIVQDLLPVQFDSPIVSISGFISRPTLTRNTAQQVYFFVNDRFVKDRILHSAMMNGYRNLLPTRRYPVVFLFYDINPKEIDINVHPTKQEIKFSREDAIFSATYGAIREAWDTREEARQETQKIFASIQQEPAEPAPSKKEWPKSFLQEKKAIDLTRQHDSVKPGVETTKPATPVETPAPEATKPEASPAPVAQKETPATSVELINRRPLGGEGREKAHVDPPKTEPRPTAGADAVAPETARDRSPATPGESGFNDLLSSSKRPEDLFTVMSLEEEGQLHVLGQLLDSYILCEGKNGLFVIDQHAAHERLKFEEFLVQSEKSSLASQDLLFPLTMDFLPAEVALLEESKDVLKQLGFDIEAFGPQTYVIRSLPSSLKFEAAEEFITDFLGEMHSEGSVQEKKERALHTLACKAAVKFGDPLPRAEMEAIIRGLEKIPRRNVCPHGRPTVLHVSDSQLRSLFKRTGF